MTSTIRPLFAAAFALVVMPLFAASASAQGLKIGVIDMQKALNDYYKTAQKVEEVNNVAKAEKEEMDQRQADYQILTKKLADLDKKARDNSMSQEDRQTAYNELLEVAQERQAKAREISEVQKRAQQKILEARSKMEIDLVTEIKGVVEAMSAEGGFDLVIDKSFLPKANKVLVYTSENVPDLTADLIAKINADAPAQ